MILRGRILHCQDYDLVHPQHFTAGYVLAAVDEKQAAELEPVHFWAAVTSIATRFARHGRRFDSRTTWWGETDMELDSEYDELDQHYAMAVLGG